MSSARASATVRPSACLASCSVRPSGLDERTTTNTPASVTPGSTAVTGARAKATHTTRLSTAAIALIVLGALLVLGCLAWALARWLAYEPRWVTSLAHSLREAGYRASATWAELGDWVRLGH